MLKQTKLLITSLKSRHFFVSVSLLLLFSFLTHSCNKPSPDSPPEPSPELSGKGAVSVTVPQEFMSHPFAYNVFSVGSKELALNKTSTGGLTGEFPVGSYSLYALKFNDKQAQIIQSTPQTATLVANKESTSARILPLDEEVYWAQSAAFEIKEAATTTVALTPRNILSYLDVEVTTGVEYSGSAIKGILSGVSDSFVLATGTPGKDSPKEIVFQLTETATPGVFTAKVGIFGVANQPANGYLLSLEINKSGNILGCSSDVTSQVVAAASFTTIPIRSTMAPATPKTPIRLYASVGSLTPKRATAGDLEGQNVGIASGSAMGAYNELWTGKVSGNEVVLSPERYYPINNSHVYLCGFYPFATPDANGNVFYNLTGSEDIMWAREQSGSLTQPFTPSSSVLNYNHLLSQFIFAIEVADNSHAYTLREISLSGIASSATLSLASGATAFGAATGTKKLYTAGTGNGLPITNGQLSLPNNLLVQPNAVLKASVTLSIDNDRLNDITITEIPVEVTGGSLSGNAYQVKLSFQNPSVPGTVGKEVGVTAKVTGWKTGTGGGIEIKPE